MRRVEGFYIRSVRVKPLFLKDPGTLYLTMRNTNRHCKKRTKENCRPTEDWRKIAGPLRTGVSLNQSVCHIAPFFMLCFSCTRRHPVAVALSTAWCLYLGMDQSVCQASVFFTLHGLLLKPGLF